MKYRIYASLYDEINEGWVWLASPKLQSRCIVLISNPRNGKKVYCEALQIEENFRALYNKGSRKNIEDLNSSLVINAWYRKRLGDFPTQSEQELEIFPADNVWGKIRSCFHHPQVIVRIGTWLGVISAILGLLSFVLAILSLLK